MADDWLEKYRPKNLDEVVGQSKYKRVLKALRKKNLQGSGKHPNMLFVGKQGLGKTALAHAYCASVWPDYRSRLLEKNASDESSIEVVRTQIKRFTNMAITDGKPKIIFLDEFDLFSFNAQAALRRMMETTSSAFFIIAANYAHKILEPVRKRCLFANIRFSNLTIDETKEMLQKVIIGEGIDITEEGLDAIAERGRGNARDAINILFTCNLLSTKITEEDVASIEGASGSMDKLFETIFTDPSKKRLNLINELVTSYSENGKGTEEIIDGLCECMDLTEEFDQDDKMQFFEKMADLLYRCSIVGYPELEIKAFLKGLRIQ